MNRKPSFDDLVGTETTGAERERLRGAHEMLVQAGPPPELTPRLQQAPDVEESSSSSSSVLRLPVKRRATMLLAAALAILAVFVAGYTFATHRNGNSESTSVATLALQGTRIAPKASATLEVWKARSGNWPMTLSVSGLPKLAPHRYYEVYLVRNGRPWGACGTFRVADTGAVTLTLNAPYSLRTGDSWIVTRPGPAGSEPGRTVLRPITA